MCGKLAELGGPVLQQGPQQRQHAQVELLIPAALAEEGAPLPKPLHLTAATSLKQMQPSVRF